MPYHNRFTCLNNEVFSSSSIYKTVHVDKWLVECMQDHAYKGNWRPLDLGDRAWYFHKPNWVIDFTYTHEEDCSICTLELYKSN